MLMACTPLFGEITVLKNFTLIDGNGGPPTPASAMVITDGRITWVGPIARLQAPRSAAVTDLSGKYVMPGIIDLHAHLGAVVDLKQDSAN